MRMGFRVFEDIGIADFMHQVFFAHYVKFCERLKFNAGTFYGNVGHVACDCQLKLAAEPQQHPVLIIDEWIFNI